MSTERTSKITSKSVYSTIEITEMESYIKLKIREAHVEYSRTILLDIYEAHDFAKEFLTAYHNLHAKLKSK